MTENTMRNPSPERMYCSLIALNSSWPAVSKTKRREKEGDQELLARFLSHLVSHPHCCMENERTNWYQRSATLREMNKVRERQLWQSRAQYQARETLQTVSRRSERKFSLFFFPSRHHVSWSTQTPPAKINLLSSLATSSSITHCFVYESSIVGS